MEGLKQIVEKVLRFEDQVGQAYALLHLSETGDYTVSKQDARFEVWSRILKENQASKKPVYVEFDPATRRVEHIFPPSERQVEYVAPEPEGDRLKVIIFMAPSIYFINTKRPNYKELRRLLEECAQNQATILVFIHPNTLEILDARSG